MAQDARSWGDDEVELVRSLKAGEPSAFLCLQQRYLHRVYRYALHRVSRVEDAEDVTCEVFVAASRQIGTFRGDAPLFSWLVAIARRKLADHHRKRHVRREVACAELTAPELLMRLAEREPELPDDFLRRDEVVHAVRAAMARLPDAQREALLLRYTEECSLEEICGAMGRSEDSVKALLRRGRASLVRALSHHDASRSFLSLRGSLHVESL